MLGRRRNFEFGVWVLTAILCFSAIGTDLGAQTVTNLTPGQKRANADAGTRSHLIDGVNSVLSRYQGNANNRGPQNLREARDLINRLDQIAAEIEKLNGSENLNDQKNALKAARISRQKAGRRLARAEEKFGNARDRFDSEHNNPRLDDARRDSLRNQFHDAREELNDAQAAFNNANAVFAEASSNYQESQNQIANLQAEAGQISAEIDGVFSNFSLLIPVNSAGTGNRYPGLSFYAPGTRPGDYAYLVELAAYQADEALSHSLRGGGAYHSRWSVWGNVTSSGGKSGPDAARQKFGSKSHQVGVDYQLTSKTKVRVGFSRQRSSSETTAQTTHIKTDTDGVGIGVATKLPFGIEARILAAWEQSSNQSVMTNIKGDYTHKSRYLALAARKQIDVAHGWWLAPEVKAKWAKADRDAYVNGFGVFVAGSEIEHSDVSAGMSVGNSWRLGHGGSVLSAFAGAESVFVTNKPDDLLLGGGAIAKTSARSVNFSAGMNLDFDDQISIGVKGETSQGQHDESRWSVTGNASLKLSAIFGDAGGEGTLGFQAQSDGKNDLGKVLLNLPF